MDTLLQDEMNQSGWFCVIGCAILGVLALEGLANEPTNAAVATQLLQGNNPSILSRYTEQVC